MHRAPSRRRGWGAGGWGQRLVLRHGVNAAVRIWRLGRELAVIWLEGSGEKSEAKAHAGGRVPSKGTF